MITSERNTEEDISFKNRGGGMGSIFQKRTFSMTISLYIPTGNVVTVCNDVEYWNGRRILHVKKR